MFPAGIGSTEILIIGVVAVLLFGSKLPDVARNLGKTYQQFRRSLTDLQSTFTSDVGSSRSTRRGNERIAHYKDAGDESDPPPPRFDAAKSTEPPNPPV